MQDQNSDFYIEQISTGCLSLFTYYIESNKEAILIDPLRDSDSYLEMAKSRGATIKYVFETHFHADFVSGHVEIAKRTGAQIVFGPGAKAEFKFHEAKDNEEIAVGNIKFRVLHTPGHTPESVTYLLLTPAGKEHSIYTGDCLFLGEVGRPDLAVKGAEITIQDLAGWLYDSLRNKILPLPDDIIVYPAHGAGSACGKNIQAGGSDTLGNQKKTNYALQKMEREEFVKILTTGLANPPQYFFHDAAYNKQEYELLEDVLKHMEVLSLEDFEKKIAEGATLIDCRPTGEGKKGFIPGSIGITLDGSYAPQVGGIVSPKEKIVVVAPHGREKEAIVRLARIGYDNFIGYLDGGFEAYVKSGKKIEQYNAVEAADFKQKLAEKPWFVDVRNRGEWESGIFEGAHLISMNELRKRIDEVPKDKPVFVHCRGGPRSYVCYTILKKYGVDSIDVQGGLMAVTNAGAETKKPEL